MEEEKVSSREDSGEMGDYPRDEESEIAAESQEDS